MFVVVALKEDGVAVLDSTTERGAVAPNVAGVEGVPNDAAPKVAAPPVLAPKEAAPNAGAPSFLGGLVMDNALNALVAGEAAPI